jgi:hypothetical protein
MTDFEIGARYEWKYAGEELSGVLVRAQDCELEIRRDDGVPGGGPGGTWRVVPGYCTYLRRVSPVGEAVEAEGDRLFESNGERCMLCGGTEDVRHSTCGSMHWCAACSLARRGEASTEIRRRRALAQPVPPAREAQNVPGSAGSADVPTREDGAATPSGEAKHNSAQPVEPGRPDPYRVHTVRTCPHERVDRLAQICIACGASGMLIKQVGTATNMLQWSDKQRAKLDQLRAELDRPVRRDKADWDPPEDFEVCK